MCGGKSLKSCMKGRFKEFLLDILSTSKTDYRFILQLASFVTLELLLVSLSYKFILVQVVCSMSHE